MGVLVKKIGTNLAGNGLYPSIVDRSSFDSWPKRVCEAAIITSRGCVLQISVAEISSDSSTRLVFILGVNVVSRIVFVDNGELQRTVHQKSEQSQLAKPKIVPPGRLASFSWNEAAVSLSLGSAWKHVGSPHGKRVVYNTPTASGSLALETEEDLSPITDLKTASAADSVASD